MAGAERIHRLATCIQSRLLLVQRAILLKEFREEVIVAQRAQRHRLPLRSRRLITGEVGRTGCATITFQRIGPCEVEKA